MRTKKKNILNLLGLVLIIIILAVGVPAGALYISATTMPKTYEDSYYGALSLKYDRLKSVSGKKIVVIGGSSVAFGIDSSIVENELGMPCVNFGLYAAIGLKPMLDLAIGQINDGDIVVIAPETSSQMYSDYIGYDEVMKGIEKRNDMAGALGWDYAKGFISHYLDFSKEASRLRANGGAKTAGVYARSSFNERGDMIFKREANIMDGGFIKDNLPEISSELVSDVFVDMINDFVYRAEKKGAKTYFSFCPINSRSAADISYQDKVDFVKALYDRLDCRLIASLDEHIMDAGYFYDSNFHMNDAGIIYNTILLINDIKKVTGIASDKVLAIAVPDVPAIPGEDNNQTEAEGGVYEMLTYVVNQTGVEITGVSAAGEVADRIEVPAEIDGVAVTKIGERAFSKAVKAVSISLPETITVMSAAVFDGAVLLERVDMNSKKLPEVGNHLLDGAPSGLKLYVRAELYGNYVTDYFWGQYESGIESMS